MLTQDGKYHYVLITDLNKLLGHSGVQDFSVHFAVMALQKRRGIMSKSWSNIWKSVSNMEEVG